MSSSDIRNPLCFIPAKAASTRLPKKNVLKINGRELIYYPIMRARESGIFENDAIIVSSESEEIKNIAERYGAKSPYLRDEKLAKDPYGVAHVVLDFFERFPDYTNRYSDLFILLPTCPLLTKDDIVRSWEIYKESGLKCLMSVTETGHNALRSLFVRNNIMEPVHPEFIKKKTQELEHTYRINGAIMIIEIKALLEKKNFFAFQAGTFIMPRERSIDIDTEFDYRLAKFIMANIQVED
jgi:CMP-N-acetylneuraminic acid synthetase